MQHNNNCNLQLAGVAWLMHEFGNGKWEEKMQKERKIVNAIIFNVAWRRRLWQAHALRMFVDN